MKNGSLIFNIILLVLIGVLFYLHFVSPKHAVTLLGKGRDTTSYKTGQFRIAYFELDSVTNSFAMVKDMKDQLSQQEESINNEFNRLQKMYNDKLAHYQGQAEHMTQVQSENANKDMLQLQETIRNKKQELDQRYQNTYMQKMQEVRTRVQEFLKEYNKDKGYSYIFGYEPGFIYYRDTIYNITNDLIRGLNEQYLKKK